MRNYYIYILACTSAATLPFLNLTHSGEADESQSVFSGWPKTILGESIRQEELKDRDRRFSEGFPGKIARFTDGRRQYIVRWITKSTRKLHPAADCFRAMGYRIKFNPVWTDSSGNKWSCFDATDSKRSLTIRERIYDSNGKTWSDASSWYWASVFNKESGPWFAVTIVEQQAVIDSK